MNLENIEVHSYIDSSASFHLALDSQNKYPIFGGGLRVEKSEIKIDVLMKLAHMMSCKYSVIGAKMSGAKAVISCNKAIDNRILRDFENWLQSLKINVRLSCDIGSNDSMIRRLGYHGFHARSFYTSLSTIQCIRTIAEHLGEDYKKWTYTIDGYGKIGESIGRELHRQGCRIIGVSTLHGSIMNKSGLDLNHINKLKAYYSDRFPHHSDNINEDVISIKSDVLVLSSDYHRITKHNVRDLKCKVLIPVANMAVEDTVFSDRKVHTLPCYMTNLGGALGAILEANGLKTYEISAIIENEYHQLLRNLLEHKRNTGEPIEQLCEKLTENRRIQLLRKRNRMISFINRLPIPKVIRQRYTQLDYKRFIPKCTLQ